MKILQKAKILAGLLFLPCLVGAQLEAKTPASAGCLVGEVREGSAAAVAGLKLGDVIFEANHSPIRSGEDLQATVKLTSGDILLIVRRGTSTENLTAHLSHWHRLGVDCTETTSASVPSPKEWYSGPKVGLSRFTGVLGWEVQYKHLGFGLGLPTTGGIRYYFHPDRHTWFAGIFGTGYGYDQDETKDGIAYTHYSTIVGGTGAGYRWLWRSRWSLELGFTVGYGEEHWTSAFYRRTDRFINLAPVATAGISF